MSAKRTISPYESVLALTFLLLIVYHFTGHKMIFLGTIAFVLLALLSPIVATYVHKAFTGLTKALGWLMSKVLMSFVFIVLLTPIAFLYRLFSKDSRKKIGNSAFVDRNHTYSPKDIESPW